MITIEVIGLAGAGKSTVTEAMISSIENSLGSYRLDKFRSLVPFAKGILRGLPLIFWQRKARLGFKSWYLLGHFEASIYDLRRRNGKSMKHVQILDQGPIFEFISIKRYLLAGSYGQYLERCYMQLLRQLFVSMDAIVYLQGRDDALLERVMNRSSAHLLKEMSAEAKEKQMKYYKKEYDQVVEQARGFNVHLIVIDTSTCTANEVFDLVLAELSDRGIKLIIKAETNYD